MMKRKNRNLFLIATCFLAAFVIWTLAVCFVDVGAIGTPKSHVGFAHLNTTVHMFTGVNWWLYTLTDWLGLIPIAIAFGFAVFGLVQWIKRKSILKVDSDILALGVLYCVVMAVYLLFEAVEINYRPVLIDGILEASYPSSTTVLVLCVTPTTMMQLKSRIKHAALRRAVWLFLAGFTVFTVVGRIFSGVHWITDIIGGALFSIGIVILYQAVRSCLISDKGKTE